MNKLLENTLKSMFTIGSQIYENVGSVLVDKFIPLYTAIMVLSLSYILITSLFTQEEGIRNFIKTFVGCSFVYTSMLHFPDLKYWIYETIITLPANMSKFLAEFEILGIKVSNGKSISATIWYTIKNGIFGVFKNISGWNFFSNFYIVVLSIFSACCLLILYFNYWAVYFIFAIELCILAIIGIPIILMSPFQTYRPVLIAWIKAMFGSALPPIFFALLMFIVKIFINESTKDLFQGTSINFKAAEKSLEAVAVTSLIAVIISKQMGKYIAILTGIQDNAFNLTNPIRSGYNLSNSFARSAAGRATGRRVKAGARAAGKQLAKPFHNLKINKMISSKVGGISSDKLRSSGIKSNLQKSVQNKK